MQQALAAWGLAEATVSVAHGGAPHEEWRIAGAPGYMLRRYTSRHGDAAIRYEHAVLGALSERSWPVPAPVVAANGGTVVESDGARWALFPQMPGASPPDEPIYRQRRGALLALLHADLHTWDAVPLDGPSRLDDIDAAAEAGGLPSFEAVVTRLRAEDPVRAAALAALHAHTTATLAWYGYARLPRAVSWGACTTEHVLFEADEVTGLLGFDGARPDARVADIAASLLAEGGGDGWHVHRWVAGYAAHADPPLSAAEADTIPVAITALALRRAVVSLAVAFESGGVDAAALALVDAAFEAESAEQAVRAVIRTAAGHPSA